MKSGFVAILGRPNVGKSTILNGILNKKISIVSEKSQTTRNAIKGIYNDLDCQIVFIDTPGIHKPNQKLDEKMNVMAFSSAHEVDASILVVDAGKQFGSGDEYLLTHLDINKNPLFIVLNKIDTATINQVNVLKDKYLSFFPKAEIIETVATEKFNLQTLLEKLKSILPDGPKFYDDETISDKDQIFQIKEIIREKVLRNLKDEVPHASAVYMSDIDWDSDPINIKANILIEKEGQKGIVIGANGKRIKLIGTQARKDIESLLNKHVFLELFVKVEKDWRNNENLLNTLGYKNEK